MITLDSPHPAIVDDRAFFAANPLRCYRARPFVPGEANLPPKILLFAADEFDQLGEINLVILKRIKGGRLRLHFHKTGISRLVNDCEIIAFLNSRGISECTFTRRKRL
jgi:hypothetical protein